MGHAYGVKNFQLQKRLSTNSPLDNAIQDKRDKANKRAFKAAIQKRIAESPTFAAKVAETKKAAEVARQAKKIAREKALLRKAADKTKRAAKKIAKRVARIAKREQPPN